MMQEHMEALRAFALRNGRNTWRERLRATWYDGNYRKWGSDSREASLLQSLRNHPSYGPGTGFVMKFNAGFPRKVKCKST